MATHCRIVQLSVWCCHKRHLH